MNEYVMTNQDAANRVASVHCILDSALVLSYDLMEVEDHLEVQRRLFAVQKLLEMANTDLEGLEIDLYRKQG